LRAIGQNVAEDVAPSPSRQTCAGSRTICIAGIIDIEMFEFDVGEFLLVQAMTSSRHTTLVSSTFALSTSQTCFFCTRQFDARARQRGI